MRLKNKISLGKVCDNCGASELRYLADLGNQALCRLCWNKITRDMGMRDHEEDEWHASLDRALKNNMNDKDREYYEADNEYVSNE